MISTPVRATAGEELSGYVTRGKGVVLQVGVPKRGSVHENEAERVVEITEHCEEEYPVDLKLRTLDRVGTLHESPSLAF